MFAAGFLLALFSTMIASQPAFQPAPAVLHGVTLTNDTLTIEVTDCGCTDMDHFSFLVENVPKGTRELTVLRLTPDWCEAVPRLVQFQFARQGRLRNSSFVLRNELRPFNPVSSDACREGF